MSSKKEIALCLNPYSNGRYSMRVEFVTVPLEVGKS